MKDSWGSGKHELRELNLGDGNAIHFSRFDTLQDRAAVLHGLDAVFFESSETQSFADDAARARFRERWLGRFLEDDARWACVAQTRDGVIAGYVVGSLDDPALSPRFPDLDYFAGFAELTRLYPAQLHVNVGASYRGLGIGGRLVGMFIGQVADAGCPGVHVITTRGMRNIGFYRRNGFAELAATQWSGKEIVFLGRKL